MLATVLLSQGVPMIQAGDEIGRTQQGNNNAYCQDNELTWLHWELDETKEDLLKFVRRVVACFSEQPVFHRRRFFHGKAIQGAEAPEIAWLDPSGQEMTEHAWKDAFVVAWACSSVGGEIDVDEHGEPIAATPCRYCSCRPRQRDPIQFPETRKRRPRGNWYSTRRGRSSPRIPMRRWAKTTPWRPARWPPFVRPCRAKRRRSELARAVCGHSAHGLCRMPSPRRLGMASALARCGSVNDLVPFYQG